MFGVGFSLVIKSGLLELDWKNRVIYFGNDPGNLGHDLVRTGSQSVLAGSKKPKM